MKAAINPVDTQKTAFFEASCFRAQLFSAIHCTNSSKVTSKAGPYSTSEIEKIYFIIIKSDLKNTFLADEANVQDEKV